MQCTNCGNPLEPGDEFCVNCGTQVSAGPGPEPTRRLPQQPPGKTGEFFTSPGGITLIVVIALLVVGGIVTGIVLGTRGGGDKAVKVEKAKDETLEESTKPATTPEREEQPSTQPAPQPGPQPAGNQTPEACQAAMLEFARHSAASYSGPPVDPGSVRLEDLQMLSVTQGIATAFGSDQYGESLMGAVYADYQNGAWVCRWEQN